MTNTGQHQQRHKHTQSHTHKHTTVFTHWQYDVTTQDFYWNGWTDDGSSWFLAQRL